MKILMMTILRAHRYLDVLAEEVYGVQRIRGRSHLPYQRRLWNAQRGVSSTLEQTLARLKIRRTLCIIRRANSRRPLHTRRKPPSARRRVLRHSPRRPPSPLCEMLSRAGSLMTLLHHLCPRSITKRTLCLRTRGIARPLLLPTMSQDDRRYTQVLLIFDRRLPLQVIQRQERVRRRQEDTDLPNLSIPIQAPSSTAQTQVVITVMASLISLHCRLRPFLAYHLRLEASRQEKISTWKTKSTWMLGHRLISCYTISSFASPNPQISW